MADRCLATPRMCATDTRNTCRFNEGRNGRSDRADEYECDVCGETFDTEAALREHAEEEHRDGEQTFDADPELAEEPEET